MSSAACIYQETRLTLDPPAESCFVDIQLASNGSSSYGSRESPKRRRIDRSSADEAVFAANHLATHSSIHFRSADGLAPKSILWRTLDNNTLLELQNVDLYNDGGVDDLQPFTLRFAFPNAIVPAGVAFAESKKTNKSDTLVLFVLTQKPELYRIILKNDAFTNTKYLQDENTRATWLAKCSPGALSYRPPYRMVVHGDSELWFALSDGALLRLEWSIDEDGSKWTDTRFAEGNWGGSLRGMLWRSHPSVRFGDVDVDSRAATTIVPAPSGKILWTVCLDHTLRAWNLSTGKTVFVQDLAGNDNRDLRQPIEQPLDPHQPLLIRLEESAKNASSEYTMVTYSPLVQAFNFWAVDESDPENIDVRPLHDRFVFAPPIDELLGVSGWRLEEFHIHPPKRSGTRAWTFWMLVRCAGKSHVLFNSCSLTAKLDDLRRTWEHGWASVHASPSAVDELRTHIDSPNWDSASDALLSSTESWADLILAPGRFSRELIETALVVYRRGQNTTRQPSSLDSHASLKEEMCATVGSALMLQTTVETEQGQSALETNLGAYERAITAQWNVFYGVVHDLQKQRERPLTLAFDSEKDLPWVVAADQVSPVRASCLIEILCNNRRQLGNVQALTSSDPLITALQPATREVGAMLNVLSLFRRSLPKQFVQKFRFTLLADVLQPGSASVQDRMQNLYEETAFHGKLSEEDFARVTDALDSIGGFGGLNNNHFEHAIQALTSEDVNQRERSTMTLYGSRFLIRGAQDTLQIGLEVLLDIALFTVFTAVELEPADVSDDFYADDLYEFLCPRVLEYELLNSLATTYQYEQSEARRLRHERKMGVNTVLENILGHFQAQRKSTGEAWELTHWIRTWTFSLGVTDDFDVFGPHVLSVLLQSGDLEHAQDFLKFLSSSPWASYIKGRYYVACSQFTIAAQHFLEAAPKLAESFDPSHWDRAHILQPDEQLHFGQGLARYYQHVLGLFEAHNSMSYVADFARLALQHLDGSQDPTARTDILSRLFTASIQTLRFDDAFAALLKYTDHALQRVALQKLVTSLISASRVPQLIALPFPPDLAAEADSHLAALAQSPAGLPAAPHQVLYAFRVRRNDFRGAAAALWEHAQQLKLARAPARDADLAASYLGCINALCLVDADMRWLLARPARVPPPPASRLGGAAGGEAQRGGRALVTLEDVRAEWQAHLDHAADMAAGRYALPLDGEEDDGDGTDMDVDVDGGDGLPGVPGAMEVDVFAA